MNMGSEDLFLFDVADHLVGDPVDAPDSLRHGASGHLDLLARRLKCVRGLWQQTAAAPNRYRRLDAGKGSRMERAGTRSVQSGP